MTSNYPPGVTGNEPQIRGMDEGVAKKKCESDSGKLHIIPDSEWIALKQLFQKVSVLRDKEADKLSRGSRSPYKFADIEATRASIVKDVENIEKWLSEYTEEMLITYTDECKFVGEVDVQYDEGYEYWDCPLCGAEHSDEIDHGPDPDDARDLAYEREMDGDF